MVIIIIPFIFWGMGGVFSSGNTNNIVKINKHNITTQNFIDYLNNSDIDQNFIKDNIDKKILEELLSELISITLLNMEIEDLKILISEKSLANKIKKNKNFVDEMGIFSRTKYEKFLLSQNLTAPAFEEQLRDSELKKKLFVYIGGGIKSPSFMTNNIYKEETAKLEIDYINLEPIYKKKENFSLDEIKKYIELNNENLKDEYIDFSYSKITPSSLTGSNDFNELFFKKIDEIENKISEEIDFNDLISELKIKTINKKQFIPNSFKKNIIEEKIYKLRNESKIQLIDENEFYLLYKINKINKKLPSIEDKNFLNKITNILFETKKYEYNKKIFDKINNKKFTNNDFIDLAKNNSIKIKEIKLNSIKDNDKFEINSVKLLYSQPVDSFVLISNKKNKIFLAKIKKILENNVNKNTKEFLNYSNQANINLKNNMYGSYNYFINDKYKVKINQKTLERVKNYFK